MPNYDVVIIGGGIAGLSLAYFLSPHRSVAVLEREEALGYHSTGRSAAEFVLRYNAPEICKLARISKAFFDRQLKTVKDDLPRGPLQPAARSGRAEAE